MGLIIGIIVGMVDPIVAGGGIITGYLWGRRSSWAWLPLGVAVAAIITIHIAVARTYQSPGEDVYAFQQICDVVLWAGLVKIGFRLCSPKINAAPDGPAS